MLSWMRKLLAPAHPADVDSGGHKRAGDAFLAQEKWQQAAQCYRLAIAAAPDYADAHINLGYVLKEQGALAEAEQALLAAAAIAPGSADVDYLLGSIALARDNPEQAVERFERALALQPALAAARRELCQALLRCGRLAQARPVLAAALAHEPASPDLLFNLANLDAHEGRAAQAIEHYRKLLALRPDHAQAHFNCGNLLIGMRRHEEALAHYDQAIALSPQWAEAWCNRGRALHGLARHAQALHDYERALALRPALPEALFNRAGALEALGELAQAEQCYDQLLLLEPDYADAHCNRGVLLERLGRHAEALASYEAAVRLQPEDGDTRFNRSMCQLLLGDFAAGWEQYEWRWRAPGREKFLRDFGRPIWLGKSDLAGKTILLHAEQGLGDAIQFVRYASKVAALGARVIVEAQPPLQTLFAAVEGVHQVVVRGQELPPFDYHCPMLSLPLAFGTRVDDIPARVPYLSVNQAGAARWNGRLGDGLKIGLVWSGNPAHKNDRYRSIALADLAALPRGPRYVSLQKEVREGDRAALERAGIAHFGEELSDFADTAALISQVDLVISVDTSVAHLAGALAKPVWLLLPVNPDWRWLLGRADSPWYPGMRLFRQRTAGEWGHVLTEIGRLVADMQAGAAPAGGDAHA